MIVKDAKTVGVVYHHSILHAMDVVDRVWHKHTGEHPRVTGLGEEGHSKGSRHYGLTGDIRIRAFDIDADTDHLTSDQQWRIDADLRKRLGVPHEYQIVWENMGTAAAHMHVEFDPSD